MKKNTRTLTYLCLILVGFVVAPAQADCCRKRTMQKTETCNMRQKQCKHSHCKHQNCPQHETCKQNCPYRNTCQNNYKKPNLKYWEYQNSKNNTN